MKSITVLLVACFTAIACTKTDDGSSQNGGQKKAGGGPAIFSNDGNQVFASRQFVCRIKDEAARCFSVPNDRNAKMEELVLPDNLGKVSKVFFPIAKSDLMICAASSTKFSCWSYYYNDFHPPSLNFKKPLPQPVPEEIGGGVFAYGYVGNGKHCAVSKESAKCWWEPEGRHSFRVQPMISKNGVTVIDMATTDFAVAALLSDKTVEWISEFPQNSRPEANEPVQKIWTSFGWGCALLDSGNFSCWGGKSEWYPPKDLKPIRMALTQKGGCAVVGDDQLRCWGEIPYLDAISSFKFRGLRDISASNDDANRICVLMEHDAVVCWDKAGGDRDFAVF